MEEWERKGCDGNPIHHLDEDPLEDVARAVILEPSKGEFIWIRSDPRSIGLWLFIAYDIKQ